MRIIISVSVELTFDEVLQHSRKEMENHQERCGLLGFTPVWFIGFYPSLFLTGINW